MAVKIEQVSAPGEGLSRVRELFLEYAASLRFSLCFQGFDEELRDLPGIYAPPSGCLLLATDDSALPASQVAKGGPQRPTEEPALPASHVPKAGPQRPTEERVFAGCVGIHGLDTATAEMKRLFVRPPFRGKGLGRTLAISACDEARARGYRSIRLDTIAGAMDPAIALYRSLGFRQIAPYRKNPIPGVLYLEAPLW